MADIFDVIADGTRREILSFLARPENGAAREVNVSGIVQELGVSQPTVSKHLKVLREAGLVSVREDGQLRFYSLDAAPLEAVGQWLGQFGVAGRPDAAPVTSTDLVPVPSSEAALSPGLRGLAVRLGSWGGSLSKLLKF